MPRLDGKVIIVTGASGGIGAAIATRLAQDGADIGVHYHSDEKSANEVLAQIQSAGRRGVLLRADLAKADEAAAMIQTCNDKLGPVDVLINNAGMETKAAFEDVTEADYDRVLEVNLKGPFFATQAFVKHLLARRAPGKVINISSVHEDLPFPGYASYCASKGGLRMLTRDLAIELGPKGITVNAIAPGAIATPINKSLLEDKPKLERLLSQIPLGRLGTPEDVAGLAAFLASKDADYVTGSTYFIDGGLTWDYHE